MKILVSILLCLFTLSLSAQNESLFNGIYFTSYFIDANGSLSGTDNLISDGVGNGTFTEGTFTYTIDNGCRFVFNEKFETEEHTYIGAVDPRGEYAILISDTASEMTGFVNSVKLSTGKTNTSFKGDFITSYYRYTSPQDMFMGLFLVTSNGVDSCTYHLLMGTDITDDEDFAYTVDNEGRVTLRNSSGTNVISGAINHTEDFYAYASIISRIYSAGSGVKKLGECDLSEIQGEYNLMQLRYESSYGEQTSSLLSILLNADGTGTYVVDANTHGESSTGTLVVSYQTNGIWKIVLDNDPDHSIYGAINPDEKLITGYFNYKGNSPGVIFGINKEAILPNYLISGKLSGADDVSIEVTGDITKSIVVENSGDSYNFEIEQGQSVTITPIKEGYTFVPASITVDNVQEDQILDAFTATINSYTISGTVSGADDVLVTLSGDKNETQTINDGSTYSFTVNYGQNVIITPSKDAYIFTPNNIPLDAVAKNQSGIDFIAKYVVAVNDIDIGKFKIYPNPTSDVLNISGENILNIEVLELRGKVLENYKCKSKSFVHINLSNKQTGLYLIRIITKEGISMKKVMKY